MATDARLDGPIGVLALPEGGFLVASGDRVRKVWSDGTISTFAGGGSDVSATDPLSVRMGTPRGLARDALGNIYIADLEQHLVRRMTPDGVLEVLVGTIVGELGAVSGYSGDGGPATEAQIGNPRGIAVHHRSLYIADQGTRHVRKVEPIHTASTPSDFDGNGRSDILWRHATTGSNAIWPGADADARQRVRAVRNADWEIVASDWQVAGIGDFDGDGQDDVLWRNAVTGRNVIWRHGDHDDQQGVRSVAADGGWTIAGTGDFDGDGTDDILWHNTLTGANVAWRGADARSVLQVTDVANLDWAIVATADYDGDGRADILWRNVETGANVVWLRADYGEQVGVARVRDQDWQVVPRR